MVIGFREEEEDLEDDDEEEAVWRRRRRFKKKRKREKQRTKRAPRQSAARRGPERPERTPRQSAFDTDQREHHKGVQGTSPVLKIRDQARRISPQNQGTGAGAESSGGIQDRIVTVTGQRAVTR